MTVLLPEPRLIAAAAAGPDVSGAPDGPENPLGPGFKVASELLAREPAEARGLERDGVRLLVGRGDGDGDEAEVSHHVFSDLPDVLRPGDLLVVNNSGTLPAALDAVDINTGTPVVLHVSTGTPESPQAWIVELRQPQPDGSTNPFAPTSESDEPASPAVRGGRLRVSGGATVTLLRPYTQRLWVARLDLGMSVADYLRRHGRAIRYNSVDRDWPIAA